MNIQMMLRIILPLIFKQELSGSPCPRGMAEREIAPLSITSPKLRLPVTHPPAGDEMNIQAFSTLLNSERPSRNARGTPGHTK
jgi:hypothetical protein